MTRAAVSSRLFKMRKNGFVKRPKEKGGRPMLEASKPKPPPLPKAAPPRAPKPLEPLRPLSKIEKDMITSARARIAEIDAKIGPLEAERARLLAAVQALVEV